MNSIATAILSAIVLAGLSIGLLTLYVTPHIQSLREQNAELRNQRIRATNAARSTAGELPTKFAAPYLLPRYYQNDRGTCWDFATLGFLEQNYRAAAVNKGYLKPDEYVRLNEQAFGISMMETCKNHPDICDVVGDFVYKNSTEGGEIYWLYNLRDLYTQLLPSAVCPYTEAKHEHECPNMKKALAKNPIKFNIPKMEIAYGVRDTKKLMYEKNSPLTWTSAVHSTVYYFSCADEYWKNKSECLPENAVRCPTDKYYGSELCAEVPSSMFNVEGEFLMAGRINFAGGHGMNVVGYNDEFVTKNGYKGGFIIKNSWYDQTYGTSTAGRGARGSHSVAYWMQDISLWEERAICPLPLNPDNWLSCAELQAGPHYAGPKKIRKANDNYDLDETCLSDEFMKHLVDVSLQPTEFVCKDEEICSKDPKYRYFFLKLERNAEQDLASACMLQYNTETKEQKTICTPYHIPSHIAYFFEPIQEQLEKLKGSEDLCGYWFWPYEMLYKQQGLLQNYFSIYFDVEWDESSFAANKAKFPQYDYSWIEKSTFKQETRAFETPDPFANTRYLK